MGILGLYIRFYFFQFFIRSLVDVHFIGDLCPIFVTTIIIFYFYKYRKGVFKIEKNRN